MLNLCLSLAASLGPVEGLGVAVPMAGELSQAGRADLAAAARDFMLTHSARLGLLRGPTPDQSLSGERFDKAMSANWQPCRFTTELLASGPEGPDWSPDAVQDLQDIERRLSGEGYQNQIYPVGQVAEATIHLARRRLTAGNLSEAYLFASVAAALMVRERPGVYTGDSYEVPEALGVLLARITLAAQAPT